MIENGVVYLVRPGNIANVSGSERRERCFNPLLDPCLIFGGDVLP